MKKKDLEKIFPNLSDEQLSEINKIEAEAIAKGKAEAEKNYQKSEYDRILKDGISSSGAKNQKAVMALLDLEKITIQNGEVEGLFEQIELLKKNCEYLFDIPQKKPQFTAQNQGKATLNKRDFDNMGYKKRLKLFSENPELYKSFTDR